MIHSSKKMQFTVDGIKMDKEIWATGFATNPNFFGTYMLLCFSYALGLFIDGKNMIKNIIYLILSAVFAFGILISNTMSCVVGCVAVLGYIFIFAIKNKQIKKILIILAIAVIVSIVGVKSGKTRIIKEMPKIEQQATEIAQGNINDKIGTNRIYIWRNALKLLPNCWLHGIGIDNFYYAFNGKPLLSPDGKYFYDKVHNEYLQILVTEGIFCFITYLVMYGIICIRGLNNSFKNKEIYLVLPIIGYLVQAFFNISVIEVAPVFFIALGLCCNKDNRLNEEK